MQVRRLAALAVLPLAATIALAACGKGSDSGGNQSGSVSIGIGEPKHLIPSNTTETEGAQVLSALYSPLVDYDDANKPFERAAKEISTTDNKTWTIKLKDGWTFHNGEPVNADSYINAWNYGAYEPNAQDSGYFWDKVEGFAAVAPITATGNKDAKPTATTLSGLKKVDETTFTVTLSAPFSEFKSLLGYTAFYPLPKAAFEDVAAQPLKIKADFEAAPIGNGPFKMKGTWVRDAKIEVEKFDAYQGDKPKVSAIEFRVFNDLKAQYSALQGNELDVVKTIPSESLVTAKGDLGDRYQQSAASSFQFLAFPMYDEAFKKLDIRTAVSMAINREELVDKILFGSAKAAHSFVSPVVAGYRENTCGDACQFKPEEAKKLYDAAGGPKTLNFYYNADGGHQQMIEAICNQVKSSLSVECLATPDPKFADLLTKAKAKQLKGPFRMGWVMDYPSMENYLGPLYTTGGSSNYYGYSNATFDALVKDGSDEATVDAAIKKYQEAEDLLVKDMPVIPLRFGQNNFGHSTNVKNVAIDLFNRVDILKIETTK